MYSGTTLTPISGRILGAHQKFDRVARKHLKPLLGDYDAIFPSAKDILRFEGRNGPDGIKRKSPAQNEPWHYINPFDMDDNQLMEQIRDHHEKLSEALAARNNTKAAFEAAWLAHAIVDGLTPAHHYPYEEELSKLRGGEGLDTRNSLIKKVVMPGSSPGKQVRNNWRMWGPKGLLSTHGTFEIGVATIIAPLTFKQFAPTSKEIQEVQDKGIVGLFQHKAKEIAALDLYRKYYKTGWTPRLARQIRHELAPTIMRVICLAWYSAAYEARTV